MASNENAIFLSPFGTQVKGESNLTAGTAFPGMLLELSANGVVVNSTEDDVAPLVIVADLAVATAGAIDTEYNTTDNDRVNWKIPHAGDLVRFHVGTATVIARGDQLASAGDGSVQVVSGPSVGVIAYAEESVTTTASTGFVKAYVK